MDPFLIQLRLHLSGFHTPEKPLYIQAIRTKASSCPPLYDAVPPTTESTTPPANARPPTEFVSKRLLLVSQRTRATEPASAVLVAGLMAYEYRQPRVRGRPAVVYIEKVDSSGFGPSTATTTTTTTDSSSTPARPRSPAAALVRAYLQACLATYGTSYPVEFHVCARPQPEYLFAKSQRNPSKRILDDRQLIRWWYRQLDSTLAAARPTNPAATTTTTISSDQQVRAHWLVPGVDAREAPGILASSTAPTTTITTGTTTTTTATATATASDHPSPRSAGPGLPWTYGYPYTPDRRAREVIPQFPDDPQTRLLAKAGAARWTVHEFEELLSISEECGAGHRTGFFVVQIPSKWTVPIPGHASLLSSPKKDGNKEEEASKDTGLWCDLSNKGWETMLTLLFHRSMDFTDTEAGQRSTQRFVQWMQRKFQLREVACRPLPTRADGGTEEIGSGNVEPAAPAEGGHLLPDSHNDPSTVNDDDEPPAKRPRLTDGTN